MPLVLIDVTRLLYRKFWGRLPTGIDRTGLEYIRRYGSCARAVLSYKGFSSVLSRSGSLQVFQALTQEKTTKTTCILLIIRGIISWWANEKIGNSVLVNTGHIDLEGARYGARLCRNGAMAVFFVHDLIPISHPQFCRAGERERHRVRMRNVLTSGRGIIAISQHTLNALARYAAEENLSMPSAAVAPLASGLPGVLPGARPIPQPYFVVVGTIEPRKNHAVLLNVWLQLIKKLGEAAPRLIVIGQRGWNFDDVVKLMQKGGKLDGFVTELNFCTDEKLITYLSHAQALLFPSFTEGFGMPLAESLSLGVPVIASDLPVFREVAAEVPEYADPTDAQKWEELIVEYADPRSNRRQAQFARLAGFRATTWENHFQIVDDFLGQLTRPNAGCKSSAESERCKPEEAIEREGMTAEGSDSLPGTDSPNRNAA